MITNPISTIYRKLLVDRQYVVAKASDSKGREGLRVSYSVIRMIRYVSFCVIDFVVTVLDVRHDIQTVTIPLLIHYCILSTTYANANYIVISNKNYRILETIGNSLK